MAGAAAEQQQQIAEAQMGGVRQQQQQPAQNLVTSQQTFLDQRRWGRRRCRRRHRTTTAFFWVGCWPALLMAVGLVLCLWAEKNSVLGHSSSPSSLSSSSSSSSPLSSVSANQQQWQQPPSSTDEQRQQADARLAHRQFFPAAGQKQRRRPTAMASDELQQQKDGQEQHQQQHQQQQQLAHPDSTYISPYSEFQRRLLSQALAEHQNSADIGEREELEAREEEEPASSSRPIIIRLDAYQKTRAEHQQLADKDGRASAGGDLLFRAGGGKAISSPSSAGSSSSSPNPRLEKWRPPVSGSSASARKPAGGSSSQRPNPIRPQSSSSSAAGSGAKASHRKRPPPPPPLEAAGIFPLDGQQQQQQHRFQPYSSSELGGQSNSGSGAKLRPLRLRQSSAEHSLITRPSAMFLPSPVPRHLQQGHQQQQQLRPIQPVNAAGGGQMQFLRRIPSIGQTGGEQIGGNGISSSGNQRLLLEQELMEQSRRLAPASAASSSSAAINSGLMALGQQLFAGASGGGQAASPPQSPPLSGSPFDLLLPGGGGGQNAVAGAGNAGANNLLSQLPNPLQMLSQGSTLEQIASMARNLLQMTNGNQELLSTVTKALSGSSASADGPASKLTSTAVTALQKTTGGTGSGGGSRAAGEKITVIDALLEGNGTKMAEKTTAAAEKIAAEKATAAEKEAAEQQRTLFSSSSSSSIAGGSPNAKGKTGTNPPATENGTVVEEAMAEFGPRSREEAINGSLELLGNLPSDQRSLLEAALRNGELEPEQAAKFMSNEKSEVGQKVGTGSSSSAPADTATRKGLINAESRLIEWIQQNRPRAGQLPTAAFAESREKVPRKDGTTKAADLAAKDWLWASAAADKLPYNGRYCGSFMEQDNSSRSHHIAGALWAVDERRLLVTKFRFQPLDHSENISFWAGPANFTGTSADFFPSQNGFYIGSTSLDAQTFSLRPIQRIEAHIRQPIFPSSNPLKDNPKVGDGDGNGTAANKNGGRAVAAAATTLQHPAEREEEEEEETEERDQKYMGGNALERVEEEAEEEKRGRKRKRAKRNLYSELYGGGGAAPESATALATQMSQMATTTLPEGAVRTPSSPTIVPIHFGGTARSFHLTLGPERKAKMTTPAPAVTSMEKLTAHQQQEEQQFQNTDEQRQQRNNNNNSNAAVLAQQPSAASFQQQKLLGWHGGVQPLLLTLPEGRLVKGIHWLAVWDHRQKHALAMVLIPADVSFHVPSTVQLRPLPSAAVGVAGITRLQSGPIRLLDTKTIEVTEFSLRTEGLPLWFMVGKEIMPNSKGQIVPLFDRKSGTFDCNSLREYHNETVTLRLPDPLDIKDVFWFALFSIPRGIPVSHIYIPFNDMQLPPDLLGLPSPQCVWNQPAG